MSQRYIRLLFQGRLLVALLALLATGQAHGQNVSPEDYGQNRIQYKRFVWQYYSTQNFNVYYSQGGIELARHAAEHAEKELKRITSLIGYYPYSKITVIVYNSVSDLKQSNIGLIDDPYKGGNDALFVKSKIEVPFEGSQVEFKQQLTYSIAELLLSDMMYGGSLKEVIQSNYLLRLPEWFVSGAAAYLAEGWSVEMDNYMRDMILKTGGKRPEPLFARNQRLTGQSIWNYIAERHGLSAIQNILNLTRITRDIEIGIASSLNMPYKRFMRDWFAYYQTANTFADAALPSVDKDNKIKKANARNYLYSEPVLSPSGKQLAYVMFDRGSYRVIVRNIDRNSQRTIYRGGFRMPNQKVDATVPLLAWRSETQIGITDYNKGKLQLRLQSAKRRYLPVIDATKSLLGLTGGVTSLANFTLVNGFDYSDDGQQMILSGVKNGQSDLYLYRGTRLARQLTNDIYDDLQPSFLPGGSRIVFSSNRQPDSLQSAMGKFASVINNFDIYVYDPETSPSRFWQLTYTPSNEVQPTALSEDEILYLGEETGIRALYKQNIKTGSVEKVTNFRQNIKTYDYNARTGNLAFVAMDRAKEFPYLYKGFPLTNVGDPAFKTKRQQVLEASLQRRLAQERARLAAAVAAKASADSVAALQISADPAQADSTVTAVATKPSTRPRTILAAAPDSLVLNRPRPYDLRFGVNNIISSVYSDPLLGFGFVMEVGMADLFEDYRIRGGVFALTDLQTSNFYAEFSNLKNRYDFRVGYQKQSVFVASPPYYRRMTKNEVLPALSYPITNALSVKVLPRYSHIRYTYIENFTVPDSVMNFGGIGGELVYDNTVVTGMNMREGTRMKVGVNQMYEFNNGNQNFGKFYADLRHYQKIHREFIWANRLSYAQFFGPAAKLILLGGVDNWIGARTDGEQNFFGINNPTPADFFYLEYAMPLRGFNYNARNGSRYVLWNSELRLPLFQYLFEGPINSGFFRNLQLVGFYEMGTAYNTGNPFSEDNSVNIQPIPQPPFEVVVRNFRNPFMYGYGWGVRTTLLGVYGRFDMAWGEKDLVREGPKLYFSMGYDF